MCDTEYIFIEPEDVRKTLQFLFDRTDWGRSGSPTKPVVIAEEDWETIIEEFKNYFDINSMGNEYYTSESQLYDFIRGQIRRMIEDTLMCFVDTGSFDLVVNKDGELSFVPNQGDVK